MDQANSLPDLPAAQLPYFDRLVSHATSDSDAKTKKPAFVDLGTGVSTSYAQLIQDVKAVKRALLSTFGNGSDDLRELRVAHLAPQTYTTPVVQLAIWAAGGISVPLLPSHPLPEMLYTVRDSAAGALVVHETLDDRGKEGSKVQGLLEQGSIPAVLVVGDSSLLPSPPSPSSALSDGDGDTRSAVNGTSRPDVGPLDEERRALMLYTSGSTGSPKGVVTTHRALRAQMESLVKFWRYTPEDRILHVLPLNHIHGTVNALHCILWAGATVEMMPRFDAAAVWKRFMEPRRDLTLYMAVPTVYSRLMAYHAGLSDDEKAKATAACAQFRLMVSGSAPLPSPQKAAWKEVSGGQVLLERYGMTETCMILSNGYEPNLRLDGHVGRPLPGVAVRLWNAEQGKDVTEELETEGEIQVKGPNVFKEYWRRPEATAKEFDGPWFRTGDVGVRSSAHPSAPFRILGRFSVDIVKTGGEKVSALEVERAVLSLRGPAFADAVVVGVADPEWGQRVACVATPKEGDGDEARGKTTLKSFRDELKLLLAAYKVPTLLIVGEIPRNPMGKVQKKEIAKLFTKDNPQVQGY